MTEYRLVSELRGDLDIDATFLWYEKEQPGLGLEFLDELRATYNRIIEGPLKYQHLRSGIRRALLRRFPYAVYFALEQMVIVVLAISAPQTSSPTGSASKESCFQ
ncbi:MAG: type II toxin-antitoxin system RelE/ParE family toxin [Deltaproteobacteria bacterium]|nr:type II toxin-antitoxin system RelE/ParE family toxin [Deltaproteobacteria bacterium]